MIAIGLVVSLIVALLGVVGIGYWIDSSLRRVDVLANYPDRPAPGRGTTWLLVGSDSRDDLSLAQQGELTTGPDGGDSGRTDTIMLVHVPELGSDTPPAIVSIPRDSYVEIPEYGEDKINAAFTQGGGRLLVQTVESATGLRLDHYAEIGFAGFAQIVDAAGGVTMCLPDATNDPLAGIDLPAGCQELDGRNALGYVRTRATARADLDRVVNQRAFISALMGRVASPAVWLNPLRWFPLKDSLSAAVTVDSGAHVWDIVRLAWTLRGSPVTATVPLSDSAGNGIGAVEWDSDAAGRLFDALARDRPIPQDVLELQP